MEGLLSLRVLMLGKNRWGLGGRRGEGIFMALWFLILLCRIRKISGLQTLVKLDVLDLHGNMVRRMIDTRCRLKILPLMLRHS